MKKIFFLLFLCPLWVFANGPVKKSQPPIAGHTFVENRGQIIDEEQHIRPDLLFTTDVDGARLHFRNTGISYVFYKADSVNLDSGFGTSPSHKPDRIEKASALKTLIYRMDLEFVNANPNVRVIPQEQTNDVLNFYLAHCPHGILNVRSFKKIIYKDLYPQIDLIYYTGEQGLKYDFIVHPGGDPKSIKIVFAGADTIATDEKGNLIISNPLGQIKEASPYSYQTNSQKEVKSNFLIEGKTVSFNIGKYDKNTDLIIDPISLVWGTYYGSALSDYAGGVTTDKDANVIVTGQTFSSNFPVMNALQSTSGGNRDAVVIKFNSYGQRLWATYYGGTSDEECWEVACNSDADIAFAGGTKSSNFPVQNAFEPVFQGSEDAFIVKLNSSGQRGWATYYGGTSSEDAKGIVFDTSGNLIIAGTTSSSNFPVMNAFQNSLAGADAFVLKFTSSGQRIWATYFGGSGSEIAYEVASGQDGSIAITGSTTSNDLYTLNGFQSTAGGGYDSFITKFTASGTPVWSTYLGGNNYDFGFSVVYDGDNNIYAVGQTASANFPVANAYQSNLFSATSSDAFIAKFSSTGQRLWATYYGGSSSDQALSIACDATDNVIVGIGGSSNNLPVLDPYQSNYGGSSDLFMAKFNSIGQRVWATYFGGSASEASLFDLTIDIYGNVLTVMHSSGGTTPTLNAFQSNNAGINDLHIAKFGCEVVNAITIAGEQQICEGDSTLLSGPSGYVKYRWNTGDTSRTIYAKTAGNYQLGAFNLSGCADTSRPFVVNFLPKPLPVISPSGIVEICQGDSIRLSVGNSFTSYQWSNNSSDAQIIVKESGKYAVRVSNANGCYNTSDSVQVIVNALPSASIVRVGPLSLCDGDSLTLTSEYVYPTYLWSTGQTTRSITVKKAGTYRLVVTNASNCSNVSENINVTVLPLSKPVITGDTTLCKGRMGILSTKGTYAEFEWSTGEITPNITITKPGIYSVRVKNSAGCTGIDSVNVVVSNSVSFSSSSPSGLDFGDLDACQKDDSLTVTITNQSERVVKVSSYSISNSAFKITTPQAGFSLSADPSRADAKKTLTIKFSPQSSGVFNDSLLLITEPCGESFKILLKGTKLQSLIKADTNTYNFGRSYSCEPQTTKDTTIIIRNSGTGQVSIGLPTVSAPYILLEPQPSEFPKSVAAGEQISLKIRLSIPAAEGPANGILDVPFTSSSCPASSITIDLLSERTKVAVEITASVIQLPDITGCDTYRDTVVVFKNMSSESIIISGMAPVAGLQLLTALPFTLEPGETVDVAMRYSPQETVTSVQAAFTYGPCDEILIVTISGRKKGVAFEMPDTITAETIILCQAPSSEGTASITNQSGVDVTLREDAVVSGPFTVTGLSKGTVLKNNIPHDFIYRFTPTGEGVAAGLIKVQFDLCDFDTTIILKATASDVQMSRQVSLAMGAVSTGSFKVDSVEIKNTGSAAVTITSFSGLDTPFSILLPDSSLIIAPKSSVFIKVRYDAFTEGDFKDTLLVESTTPCAILLQTEITAGGAAQLPGTSDIHLSVSNAQDTARAGETVRISLKINSSRNLVQSNATSYTAVISFNKNLLQPINATPHGTISGSRRIITFTGSRNSGDTLGILKEIDFRALLGDSACTNITLDSFNWTNGDATATTSGTIFCLAELCQAGGSTRLVSSGGEKFMLYQNKPNPAGNSTEIEYSLVEPGHTELILMDMLGRTIKTVIRDNHHKAGRYTTILTADDIPQGMYIMLLKSPTQSQSLILQVQK